MSSGIDYPLGETVHILFTTRSFSTGAPTTLSGTPVLSVYEDDSATQITAGVSVGADHDSVTGLNLATIVATGGNGYETGKSYHVVITTGTVGGVSVVGEVVGSFSIERSAVYGRVGAPAGASVSADIAAIEAQTDDIGVAGAGLTAVPWNSAWDAEVQSEVDDALVAQGLDHLVNAAVVGADITDDSIIAQLASASATADWDDFVNTTDSLQAIRDKQTDIETDTQDLQTQVGTAGAGLTDVGGLSTTAKGHVNAEVVDVLKTDTITLPGQTAPPATPTFEEALSWLFKTFRNKKTQTSTTWSLFDDAGSTVDSKATVSDSGGTATKEEIVTGP